LWSRGAAKQDKTTGLDDRTGMPGMPTTPGSQSADASPAWWSELNGHLVMWAAMVLATMLPLVVWNLRQVGLRSPRARRRAATVDVAAGWLAVWLGAGVVLCAAALLAMRTPLSGPVVAVVVGLAVAWQPTRMKRVAVARCHRLFAPPLGRTARRDCVRFGGTLGRDCVVACWPSMLVMTTFGHRLSVVVPLAWLSWRDRRRPPDRPGTCMSAAVLLLVGLLSVLASPGW
jgi:predicted metal-binding membrane protein